MPSSQSISAIRNVFRLLGLPPPSGDRLNRLADEYQSGQRSLGAIRDSLIQWMADSQGITFNQALGNVIRGMFERYGVAIAAGGESESQRIQRLVDEVLNGRSLGDLDKTIKSFAPAGSSGGGAGGTGSGGGSSSAQPPPEELPEQDPVEPEPIDFEAQVEALFPYLPNELVKIFADAWAESGDADLALAEMRQSSQYDKYFAGNRREDGSLRMSEAEYLATMDGYRRMMSDFGLNPDVFSDRFVGLIEGDVSVQELAQRLGAAYEGIVTNIPQVREFYAQTYGLELSDQAIFAGFIDPDIGQQILNRQIAVAQIGGEGLARGFDVDELTDLAGDLADAGLDQGNARQFFTTAEARLPILERLAQRHADPDDTFDLGELADAAIFGDSEQARRIRRLLDAEASLFSDQLGTVVMDDSLRLTGLQQQ